MTNRVSMIESIYKHINGYNLSDINQSQKCFMILREKIDFIKQQEIVDSIKSNSDMLKKLKKDLAKLYCFLDL